MEGELIRRALHTLSIIRGVVYLLAGAWFLRWTFLCACNAKRIAPQNPDINPGIAVSSYFVPLLNLFGPYQQVQEIVEVVEKRLDQHDIRAGLRPWWLAWWGMNAVWLLGTEVRTPAVMIGEWILTLAASFWAVRLVSRLTDALSRIHPPFEVVHHAPKPKPKREQVRRASKPGYAAAKPSGPLPMRATAPPPKANRPADPT